MKFKSEKWEMFLKDPAKRECLKYKRLEQYVYQHLDRAAPAGDQAQQSTQPTIEQSQVDEEASVDSQQSFAPSQSTPANSSQIQPTPANSSQLQPTTAKSSQLQPTSVKLLLRTKSQQQLPGATT